MIRLKNQWHREIFLISLAFFCFSYSLYIAIEYANQVPLDLYAFRQTQTALTAYWFVKNGFSLAYETPVAGPPWSIPFEFPIYQYIVALASQVSGFSLDATGRVVSSLFLVISVIPVRSITKKLNISNSAFYIFVALLFSSPLYLYWGRSFMIETAALFFSIAAMKYFVDIVQEKNSFKNGSLFLIFITLSILQKATTGLPLLAMLCLLYFILNIKVTNSMQSSFYAKKIILALIYFGIPLAIGVIWTLYTDQIKTLNRLGIYLTSKTLSTWNWGTLSQRLSFELYYDVIWRRGFARNLSGSFGVAILMIALFSNAKNSIKSVVIISGLMWLVPLFLFTNLYIIHDYYSTANVIFLIFAIAVSLGHILNNYFNKNIILYALTIIMVMSNYLSFYKGYLNDIKQKFNKANSPEYAVSEIIKKEIPQEKYFVAFGNDWSSSLSYLSERKSFTVPMFINQYEKLSLYPEYFIEETNLGGVILCFSVTYPTINDLIRWSSTNRNWKIGETHGYYIAVPEAAPANKSSIINCMECQGSIDFAGEIQVGNHKILSVNGWTTVSGKNGIVPEKVYVTLKKKNSEPIYFETLQVNRPDVNAFFGRPNDADSGFSRLIDTNLPAGEYVVGVARLNQGRLETCQFQKRVSIHGGSINE